MRWPSHPSDLVVAQMCANTFEAAFLKAYLESEGVEAWFDGEDSRGFTGRYSVVGRGVALRVRKQNAKRALLLLEHIPDPPEYDEGEDVAFEESEASAAPAPAPESCPNCGSASIARSNIPRWLMIVLLGLPALFRDESWCCSACGWQWTPGRPETPGPTDT